MFCIGPARDRTRCADPVDSDRLGAVLGKPACGSATTSLPPRHRITQLAYVIQLIGVHTWDAATGGTIATGAERGSARPSPRQDQFFVARWRQVTRANAITSSPPPSSRTPPPAPSSPRPSPAGSADHRTAVRVTQHLIDTHPVFASVGHDQLEFTRQGWPDRFGPDSSAKTTRR